MNFQYFKWADVSKDRKDYLRDHFTLGGREMRSAIDDGLLEYCFIAFGPKGGIVGWAGLYKYGTSDKEIFKIGVFVRREYRHCGVGEALRKGAVGFALDKFEECFWFEARRAGGVWMRREEA